MNKVLFASAAAIFAVTIFAAPVIRDQSVVFSQDSLSRKVQVTYALDGDPGIVTFDVLTNGVSIGQRYIKPLSGDVNRIVQPGENKRILWRPDKSWPGHKIDDGSVSVVVTAWATNTPPDYMMIDIASGVHISAAERTTYYTHPDAIPFEGGVKNAKCKTDYLVFRKCPAANVTYRMGTTETEAGAAIGGSSAHYVTFTNDFWIGVYELTQQQYSHLTCWPESTAEKGYTGACFTNECAMRPIENVQFYWLRGWSNFDAQNPVSGGRRKLWPETGHEIMEKDACGGAWGSPYAKNILYYARELTGQMVDFPTEAQWEFAARAGCGGNIPDGTAFAASVGGLTGGERICRYARTSQSGGVINGLPVAIRSGQSGSTWLTERTSMAEKPTEGGTAVVGSYLPNEWGIYDMCGNVAECCLDNWQSTIPAESVIDPVGPLTTGQTRVVRGGSWKDEPQNCLTSSRMVPQSNVVNYGFNYVGFRLCVIIP